MKAVAHTVGIVCHRTHISMCLYRVHDTECLANPRECYIDFLKTSYVIAAYLQRFNSRSIVFSIQLLW
jgi:hypothetical protein